jgi:hypothetical protein
MGFSLEDWINRQISGIEAHPLRSGLEAAGIGAAVALPFLAPEIGAGLGLADLGAGAADVGFGAADVGFGAADAAGAVGAADAGLGAADLGAGAVDAGLAADLGAGAVDAGVVGGLGVADALDTAGLAGAGADLSGLGGSLGTSVGGDAANALALAPDISTGATPATSAATSLAAGTTPSVPSAAAAFTDPATELAGTNTNIDAALGADPGSLGSASADAAPATLKEGIAANNPLPGANTGLTGGGGAAPAASSSLTSQLGGVLNSPWTKAAELALPLGFLGSTLYKGAPGIPQQAQQAVNNAQAQAAQLSPQATQNVPLFNQTAATDLTNATNNQISPAQAATLAKYVQDQTNQRYQFYASHGVTDPNSDSRFLGDVAQIKQDALAQQTAMITQLINTAFQSATAANAGLGTAANINSGANNALLQAAQLQAQGDQQYNQAVGDALKSFGLLAAVSTNSAAKPSAVQNAVT